jgi:hypothetical protein
MRAVFEDDDVAGAVAGRRHRIILDLGSRCPADTGFSIARHITPVVFVLLPVNAPIVIQTGGQNHE